MTNSHEFEVLIIRRKTMAKRISNQFDTRCVLCSDKYYLLRSNAFLHGLMALRWSNGSLHGVLALYMVYDSLVEPTIC